MPHTREHVAARPSDGPRVIRGRDCYMEDGSGLSSAGLELSGELESTPELSINFEMPPQSAESVAVTFTLEPGVQKMSTQCIRTESRTIFTGSCPLPSCRASTATSLTRTIKAPNTNKPLEIYWTGSRIKLPDDPPERGTTTSRPIAREEISSDPENYSPLLHKLTLARKCLSPVLDDIIKDSVPQNERGNKERESSDRIQTYHQALESAKLLDEVTDAINKHAGQRSVKSKMTIDLSNPGREIRTYESPVKSVDNNANRKDEAVSRWNDKGFRRRRSLAEEESPSSAIEFKSFDTVRQTEVPVFSMWDYPKRCDSIDHEMNYQYDDVLDLADDEFYRRNSYGEQTKRSRSSTPQRRSLHDSTDRNYVMDAADSKSMPLMTALRRNPSLHVFKLYHTALIEQMVRLKDMLEEMIEHIAKSEIAVDTIVEKPNCKLSGGFNVDMKISNKIVDIPSQGETFRLTRGFTSSYQLDHLACEYVDICDKVKKIEELAKSDSSIGTLMSTLGSETHPVELIQSLSSINKLHDGKAPSSETMCEARRKIIDCLAQMVQVKNFLDGGKKQKLEEIEKEVRGANPKNCCQRKKPHCHGVMAGVPVLIRYDRDGGSSVVDDRSERQVIDLCDKFNPNVPRYPQEQVVAFSTQHTQRRPTVDEVRRNAADAYEIVESLNLPQNRYGPEGRTDSTRREIQLHYHVGNDDPLPARPERVSGKPSVGIPYNPSSRSMSQDPFSEGNEVTTSEQYKIYCLPKNAVSGPFSLEEGGARGGESRRKSSRAGQREETSNPRRESRRQSADSRATRNMYRFDDTVDSRSPPRSTLPKEPDNEESKYRRESSMNGMERKPTSRRNSGFDVDDLEKQLASRNAFSRNEADIEGGSRRRESRRDSRSTRDSSRFDEDLNHKSEMRNFPVKEPEDDRNGSRRASRKDREDNGRRYARNSDGLVNDLEMALRYASLREPKSAGVDRRRESRRDESETRFKSARNGSVIHQLETEVKSRKASLNEPAVDGVSSRWERDKEVVEAGIGRSRNSDKFVDGLESKITSRNFSEKESEKYGDKSRRELRNDSFDRGSKSTRNSGRFDGEFENKMALRNIPLKQSGTDRVNSRSESGRESLDIESRSPKNSSRFDDDAKNKVASSNLSFPKSKNAHSRTATRDDSDDSDTVTLKQSTSGFRSLDRRYDNDTTNSVPKGNPNVMQRRNDDKAEDKSGGTSRRSVKKNDPDDRNTMESSLQKPYVYSMAQNEAEQNVFHPGGEQSPAKESGRSTRQNSDQGAENKRGNDSRRESNDPNRPSEHREPSESRKPEREKRRYIRGMPYSASQRSMPRMWPKARNQLPSASPEPVSQSPTRSRNSSTNQKSQCVRNESTDSEQSNRTEMTGEKSPDRKESPVDSSRHKSKGNRDSVRTRRESSGSVDGSEMTGGRKSSRTSKKTEKRESDWNGGKKSRDSQRTSVAELTRDSNAEQPTLEGSAKDVVCNQSVRSKRSQGLDSEESKRDDSDDSDESEPYKSHTNNPTLNESYLSHIVNNMPERLSIDQRELVINQHPSCRAMKVSNESMERLETEQRLRLAIHNSNKVETSSLIQQESAELLVSSTLEPDKKSSRRVSKDSEKKSRKNSKKLTPLITRENSSDVNVEKDLVMKENRRIELLQYVPVSEREERRKARGESLNEEIKSLLPDEITAKSQKSLRDDSEVMKEDLVEAKSRRESSSRKDSNNYTPLISQENSSDMTIEKDLVMKENGRMEPLQYVPVSEREDRRKARGESLDAEIRSSLPDKTTAKSQKNLRDNSKVFKEVLEGESANGRRESKRSERMDGLQDEARAMPSDSSRESEETRKESDKSRQKLEQLANSRRDLERNANEKDTLNKIESYVKDPQKMKALLSEPPDEKVHESSEDRAAKKKCRSKKQGRSIDSMGYLRALPFMPSERSIVTTKTKINEPPFKNFPSKVYRLEQLPQPPLPQAVNNRPKKTPRQFPYLPSERSLPAAKHAIARKSSEDSEDGDDRHVVDEDTMYLSSPSAPCTRQNTLNAPSTAAYPYSTSIKSLPLDEEDYKAIAERAEKMKKKARRGKESQQYRVMVPMPRMRWTKSKSDVGQKSGDVADHCDDSLVERNAGRDGKSMDMLGDGSNKSTSSKRSTINDECLKWLTSPSGNSSDVTLTQDAESDSEGVSRHMRSSSKCVGNNRRADNLLSACFSKEDLLCRLGNDLKEYQYEPGMESGQRERSRRILDHCKFERDEKYEELRSPISKRRKRYVKEPKVFMVGEAIDMERSESEDSRRGLPMRDARLLANYQRNCRDSRRNMQRVSSSRQESTMLKTVYETDEDRFGSLDEKKSSKFLRSKRNDSTISIAQYSTYEEVLTEEGDSVCKRTEIEVRKRNSETLKNVKPEDVCRDDEKHSNVQNCNLDYDYTKDFGSSGTRSVNTSSSEDTRGSKWSGYYDDYQQDFTPDFPRS